LAQSGSTSPAPDSQDRQSDKTSIISEEVGQETDDEDIFSDDQEIFSLRQRKLFQKKLVPLTNKERIVWAFRLSETNTFL
jgi:predicted DNA binding CopG/RHH family protein